MEDEKKEDLGKMSVTPASSVPTEGQPAEQETTNEVKKRSSATMDVDGTRRSAMDVEQEEIKEPEVENNSTEKKPEMSVDTDAASTEPEEPKEEFPESEEKTEKKTKRNHEDRPIHKLSVKLLLTYKHINEVYYSKKRMQLQLQSGGKGDKRLSNDGYDDGDGNYIVHRGEEIYNRYIVTKVLGKGSFAVVVEARDMFRNEDVALKIIKNKRQFHQQAQLEIKILRLLNENDPSDRNHIVRLKKIFEWRNHLCLSFELCSLNLYELIRHTRFRGVSLHLVRKFAYQVLSTLAYLAQSDIIHCDLKPENILLRNPRRSAVKVVDFGSACFVRHRMYKYIQSRFYRCPEVLLGLPYGCPIDMWSLGCIIVELHTGMPIFDGRDECDQVYKIVEVLGFPSQSMIKASPKWKRFYTTDLEGNHIPTRSIIAKTRELRKIIGADTGGPGGRRSGEKGHAPEDYDVYLDLITKMLTYDPEERIKPDMALQHPFFASLIERMNAEQGGGATSSTPADGGTTPAALSTNGGDSESHAEGQALPSGEGPADGRAAPNPTMESDDIPPDVDGQRHGASYSAPH